MLRSIPAWKFEEWKVFEELDPDLSYRLDWGLAHIVQVIMRDGKLLRDFILPFGDAPASVPLKQSLKTQEMAIDAWISGSNARARERMARGLNVDPKL